MHTVLDLDLDFFGWPPLHYQEGETERPAESEFKHLADETEVRNFLEHQCHLSRSAKIPGREFVEHLDAFHTWKNWIQDGTLIAPFVVVHVDGHSDLGAGMGLTCHYIETELLALPVPERSTPRFDEHNGITSANYLIAAIANQWISRLTYVYPVFTSVEEQESHLTKLQRLLQDTDEGNKPNLPSDLPQWCFQRNDYAQIQLAHRKAQGSLYQDRPPIRLEPPVPFDCKTSGEFETSGFTHLVVAQSPQYIPASSDSLLCVIRDYFMPI